MLPSSPPLPRKSRLTDIAKHAASMLVIVLLIVFGFWGSHLLTLEIDSGETSEPAADFSVASTVELTAEKLKAAGIQVSDVTRESVQPTRTVAATIDYNATKHVVLKAPVDCVVEQVRVKPGQAVMRGEPLVALSGAEVALARSEIRQCEAELEVARINYDWARQTHENLVSLLTALETAPPVAALEADFQGKALGEHGDHLLTAYARYRLTSNVADQTRPLGERGIVSGRTFEARASERDIAATAFKTAREQSDYESRRELAAAAAEFKAAEQRLAVQQERLRLLLGPFSEGGDRDPPGNFELKAPFDGQVEALHAASAARIEEGEPLLTVANTNMLWVSAWIHQHDWEVLQLPLQENVRVRVPAMPDSAYPAKISFVGPEISPTTRAVSVVAELENDQGKFRPGMFAWVALPVGPARESLVVPTGALLRHEGQTLVFVQESERRFRRVDVQIGVETPDRVEVLAGLELGQVVVTQGAYYLQAEMLLEQEAE